MVLDLFCRQEDKANAVLSTVNRNYWHVYTKLLTGSFWLMVEFGWGGMVEEIGN